MIRLSLIFVLSIVLVGCDGTEGGNPNRTDGGPTGGACVPGGDAGPSGDGGVAVVPIASCDPDGTGADACACAAQAPSELATAAERILDVTLHGPTPSGRVAAVIAQPCFGGLCPAAAVDVPIRVHRFGADGAAIGGPIEVPGHLYARPRAALDGHQLALAWTNVGGLDVPGELRFAVLDVETGAWALEPRTITIDRPSMATPVAVIRRGEGWASVWTGFRSDGIADLGVSYLVPIAADGTTSESIQLPAEQPHLAPHSDGHALVYAHEAIIAFRTIRADGTVSDAVTVAEGHEAIAFVPRPGGYRVAYGSPSGLRVVDLDSAGGVAGAPWQLASLGVARAVSLASDGSTWVLWQQPIGCRDGRTSTELLLAHLGADGTRLGTDIAFSRNSSSGDAVALVTGARGPIVASTTFEPTSRVVLRAMCVPD